MCDVRLIDVSFATYNDALRVLRVFDTLPVAVIRSTVSILLIIMVG